MKIPTTPPGSAPYYHCPPMNGVELNPPWQQGNGVMMEGNVPNNNGTYMMQQQVLHHGVPPPQAHHAPPNTGYMSQQAGGGSYYSPSEPEDSPTPPHTQDFSEYMWMGNQEEFDKQVIQQLEEEALMEQCIEAMLADEREGLGRPSDLTMEEQVSKSTLNPLAPEFVPSFLPSASISTPTETTSSSNTPVTEPCEPPTEALNDLAISKSSNKSPTPSEESGEEIKKIEKVDSDIVVVSAKSSIDDSEKLNIKRERKDSDKKKSDTKKKTSEPSKKEKAVVAAVALSTAAVVGAKNSSKANTPRPRTQSGGDKPKPTAAERKSLGSVKKVDKEEPQPAQSKKQEVKVEDVVDLQGPPLPSVNVPIVSALSALPVMEPEKASPAAPVVFNYAAAAKANLPPKSSPPLQTPPPSKETTPTPAVTAPKPPSATPAPSKANGATDAVRSTSTKKADSAKPNESKRVSVKGSSATKKGSKK